MKKIIKWIVLFDFRALFSSDRPSNSQLSQKKELKLILGRLKNQCENEIKKNKGKTLNLLSCLLNPLTFKIHLHSSKTPAT